MRLGWAFINSSLTSSVANGPTNSVQFNSGSQRLSGSSNLIFNPATNTLSLVGTITGSTAQFTTITGSIVTGSTAQFTTITVTNITSTGNISANNLSASANVQGNSLTIIGSATISGTVDIHSVVQARGTSIRTTNGSGTVVRTQMDSSGNIYASSSLNVSGTATVSGSVFSTGGIAGRFQNFSINFTVPTNSYICSIDTSASAVTASLGAANTYYSGQTITFKDTAGYAGVAGKQILILPSGSQKIDGQSGLQIATTSGSATITTDGLTSFYIISTI